MRLNLGMFFLLGNLCLSTMGASEGGCGQGIDSSSLQDSQVTLRGVGDISGVVVDDTTSEPVVGASVKIGGKTEVTDETGAFFVSGINAGEQMLTIQASGYKNWVQSVAVNQGANALGTIRMNVGSSADVTLRDFLVNNAWFDNFFFDLSGYTEDSTGTKVVVTHSLSENGAWHQNWVVHDPGTSGKAMGDLICSYWTQLQLNAVEGMDPKARQAGKTSGYGSDCPWYDGSAGTGDWYVVLQVLAVDNEGAPLWIGSWSTVFPDESIPTGGFAYEGQGEGLVIPERICPANSEYGDPQCVATCYWGPGVGQGCPTFNSVTTSGS